jgi:hypothetical protein
MDISVQRTGGFAGLTEEVATVNTTQLNPATQQQVEHLVQNMSFFALPATVSSSKIGADLFRYTITVQEGAQHHTVTFVDDDSGEGAPLRQLVETLRQLGK